jgi:hypothetical protein
VDISRVAAAKPLLFLREQRFEPPASRGAIWHLSSLLAMAVGMMPMVGEALVAGAAFRLVLARLSPRFT